MQSELCSLLRVLSEATRAPPVRMHLQPRTRERERERERECSVSADEKDAFSRGEQRKSRLYRANGVVDIEPGVALLKRVDVSSSMNEDDHRTLSAVIGEFDVIRCRGTQFTPRNSTNRRRGR